MPKDDGRTYAFGAGRDCNARCHLATPSRGIAAVASRKGLGWWLVSTDVD